MEHHGNPAIAIFNTIISIGCGFIAFVSMKDVQVAVSISAGSVSIICGCFAIRYYIIASRRK